MAVGCYVIGEDVIHLKPPETERVFQMTEAFIQSFINACKKLPVKLDCLVIVDPEMRKPDTLYEFYKIGKEYANSVYIIPAIVAVLQYTISTIKTFYYTKVLILIRINAKYYACCLMKQNEFQFFPYRIKTENTNDFQHNFYSDFTEVYCTNASNFAKQNEDLKLPFPSVILFKMPSPMLTLAMGGFYKAQCVGEPGKHLEMINFTLGIFNGNNNTVVKRCATFPLKVEYQLTPGISHLKVVHVWSTERQTSVVFNFAINERSVKLFNEHVKNLFTDEWLNNADQTSVTKMPSNGLSSASNLHTILVDKKCENYINGPVLSIVPTYIGILQYYITLFKPTTPTVIIIVITKTSSKFYTLIERSPLSYTVTYASDYDSEDYTFFDSIIRLGKKIKILYICENGFYKKMPLKSLSTKISFTQHEVINIHEVAYYGGAIYALHNSSETLLSQYVTIDPFFDPEENNCDGLSPISIATSKCFYEINAFFHGALKSIVKLNSFYGNLIAIILQHNFVNYIYFFVHVENKFLFKYCITADGTLIIDATFLHYADVVVSVDSSEMPTFADHVQVTSFTWRRNEKVDEYLSDMKADKRLIYDTTSYSKAITNAKNENILENITSDKIAVMVKCDVNKYQTITNGEQYVTIDPLFDPEENSCDGLATISMSTSKCFYVADAYFHCALKSIIHKNLSHGNLITVLIKRLSSVYIYFFVYVKNSFLFKFDLVVRNTVTIDAPLLHNADIVMSESSQRPKYAANVMWTSFSWKRREKVREFLHDMKGDKLLVYDTTNYLEAVKKFQDNLAKVIYENTSTSTVVECDADKRRRIIENGECLVVNNNTITNAKNIFEDVIYEKNSMVIEYESDKCRIITENGGYLVVGSVEWIPMYISFSQSAVLVGNEATKDLEKSPHSVIYDFVQLLGVRLSMLTSYNRKWSFKLVEMDDLEDPKLGYKVTTADGCKIISPEMALTIYLQKLILIYEKFTGKTVDEICFKLSNTVLTEVQKESFINASKRLKKYCVFC